MQNNEKDIKGLHKMVPKRETSCVSRKRKEIVQDHVHIGTSGELSSFIKRHNYLNFITIFTTPFTPSHTLCTCHHSPVTRCCIFSETSNITGKETDCFTNKYVNECQIPLKEYYQLLYLLRKSFLTFWQKKFDTVSTQYAIRSQDIYMLTLHIIVTNTSTL